MNPIIAERVDGLGAGFLLGDDIAGIQDIYGTGLGSVTPLDDVGNPPGDEPDGPGEDDEGDEEPAGVTATFDRDTGTLAVNGDAQANSVLLVSVRCLTVVVGLEGTAVNGGPADALPELEGAIHPHASPVLGVFRLLTGLHPAWPHSVRHFLRASSVEECKCRKLIDHTGAST